MYPDPKQEYIAEIEAWETLSPEEKATTPKPLLKSVPTKRLGE